MDWGSSRDATGKIAEQSQRLIQDFLLDRPDMRARQGDVTTLGGDFIELTTKMMADPAAVARAQIDLFNDSLRVWQTTAERLMGLGAGTEAPLKDKRSNIPTGPRARSSISSKRAISFGPRLCSRRCAASRGSTQRPRARSTSIRASSSTRSHPPISSQPNQRFSSDAERADKPSAGPENLLEDLSAARVGSRSP